MRPTEAASGIKSPLIRRPIPKRCESLRGYALRIDHENTINLFTRHLTSLDHASNTLAEMERTTARNLDELRQRVFVDQSHGNSSSSVQLFEHQIPRMWISTSNKRICPMCIKEHGHMNAFWELDVVRSCFLHRCHLIDMCQSCNAPLQWSHGGLMQCQCGAFLCEIEPVAAGPMRLNLDLLLVECLLPTVEGMDSLSDTDLLKFHSKSGSTHFVDYSFIASVFASRIEYSTELSDTMKKDEQQAEFALRMIKLGSTGVETALFHVLEKEIQKKAPGKQLRLLTRSAMSRRDALQSFFKLTRELQKVNFVQKVLFPAWDEVHKKWTILTTKRQEDTEAQAIQKANADRKEAKLEREMLASIRRSEKKFELKEQRELASNERKIATTVKRLEQLAQSGINERKYFEMMRDEYHLSPGFLEFHCPSDLPWFFRRLEEWGHESTIDAPASKAG